MEPGVLRADGRTFERRDRDEVYPVIHAVGGTSPDARRVALGRIVRAGAQPVSWVQLICELQRDWNRKAIWAESANILFASEAS